MLGHNSAQGICSEVACYRRETILSLSLICRSCYRESPLEEEHGLPSYVETGSGNSLYSCYSLSNNGTIAVCASHLTLLLFCFPPKCVFVHVMPLECFPTKLLFFMLIMTSVCIKQQLTPWHITVWCLENNKTLKHSTYTLCNSIMKKPSMSPLKGGKKIHFSGMLTLERSQGQWVSFK